MDEGTPVLPRRRMTEGIYLVCLYGPESTGKTTIAASLAEKYQTTFVPEVARDIIVSNDTFTLEDIALTGKTQIERTFEELKHARKILFCDSDIITTRIYSQYYLGSAPSVLDELEKMISYDCYFFFDIDVVWVDDGVRDLGTPSDREKLYKIFSDELDKRKIKPVQVRGSWEERIATVVEKIDALIGMRER